MGQCTEWCENGIVGNPYRIGPIFRQLLAETLNFVTNDDGFEFHFQRIGQFAALGQQFETHVGDLVAFEFDIYKYIVHLLRAD